MRYILLSLLIFTLCSCQKHYLYDPNDNLYISKFSKESKNALIVYDSEYKVSNEVKQLQMHFINVSNNSERVNKQESYDYYYDLINYPKKDQFYGLPNQYGLKSYVVEPGTYVLARCEANIIYDGRPNHCPPNFMQYKNNKIGFISFTVAQGDVLCLGKLKIRREDQNLRKMAEVEVEDNCDKAEALVQNQYPELVKKIKNYFFRASPPSGQHQPEYRPVLPDSFFILQGIN